MRSRILNVAVGGENRELKFLLNVGNSLDFYAK